MFRTIRNLAMTLAAVTTLATYNRPWVTRPQYQPYWPRYGFNRYPTRWTHHHHYVRWHRPHVHVAPLVTTYAPRTYVATPPAPTYTAAPAPAPVAPVANRSTCLTKEYTQDGQVVFRDVCTQEMAAAPNGPAPQAEPAPAQHAPAPHAPAPQPQFR
jgi:hypothetical protein